MSLYLMSCELTHGKEFGDYEYLHAELRKFRAKKVLQATWICRSSLNSETIRDALTRFIHEDDKILVAEISVTNWAGWKAMLDIADV